MQLLQIMFPIQGSLRFTFDVIFFEAMQDSCFDKMSSYSNDLFCIWDNHSAKEFTFFFQDTTIHTIYIQRQL